MDEAKSRAEWDRAALVCAVMANSAPNFGGKRKAFGVADFHPWLRGRGAGGGTKITADNIELLKCLVPKKNGGWA